MCTFHSDDVLKIMEATDFCSDHHDAMLLTMSSAIRSAISEDDAPVVGDPHPEPDITEDDPSIKVEEH
jgi:hypothetical protein